jgi:GT2 family glycosyltransferase
VKWIDKCLPPLLNTDYENLEIIFVDNGSTDGTFEHVVKYYSHPKIILKRLEENAGFTGGNNYGVIFAKGEFLLFISIDVVLEKGTLKKLLLNYDRNKHAVVGPVVINTSEEIPNPKTLDHEIKYLAIDLWGYPALSTQKISFYIEGCVFLIEKEKFKKLRGFDEGLVTYAEDVDLSWRAWLFGYENIMVKDAIAYHYGGSSSVNYGKYDKTFETTYYRRYHTLKNIIRNQIKNSSLHNIIWTVPVQLILITAESFYYLLIQRNLKSFAIVHKAVLWNIAHLHDTLKFRGFVQKMRTKTDLFIMRKMVKFPGVLKAYLEIGVPKFK